MFRKRFYGYRPYIANPPRTLAILTKCSFSARRLPAQTHRIHRRCKVFDTHHCGFQIGRQFVPPDGEDNILRTEVDCAKTYFLTCADNNDFILAHNFLLKIFVWEESLELSKPERFFCISKREGLCMLQM